jgi:hypothetical protein
MVNRVGGWLRRCGLPISDLSEESVLRAAHRATGLHDWGGDHYRVALRALLEDFAGDERLTFLGRAMARSMLIQYVTNRLRIRADLQRYPEILRGVIRRPLFIVGLPRTGTTLLHHLLAQDSAARPLLFWESVSPSPPPDIRTRDRDPRIKRAERMLARMYRNVPRLSAIHRVDPRGPEECLLLLRNAFIADFQIRTPTFQRWLWELSAEDVRRAYEEYREQLLLLQWRCPGDHWVLKAPVHLFGLGALLATFPDACIVQTHRNPLECVPSMCSLVSVLDEIFYDRVDAEEIGRRTTAMLEEHLDRGMKARQSAGPGRFFDLPYQELVADPIAAVRKIYHYFGHEFRPALADKLAAYLAENPQHKHGAHRYSLEDFGLDRDALQARFAAYWDRFGGGEA